MVQAKRIGWWLGLLAATAGFVAFMVFVAIPPNPQQRTQRMQAQIAKVRGLQFKRDVVVHEQSQEEFQKHAKSLVGEVSAPEQEQVLRTLGLLASDETLDSDAVRKRLDSDGPAGAYDPYSGRLLIVKAPYQQRHATALDDLYARELYRALLDQHFDLKTYLDRRQGGDALNADEKLARRIVVESEAFYGAVLRRVREQTGQIPKYLPLNQALEERFRMEEIMGWGNDPRLREKSGRRKPQRDPDSVPTFLTQLLNALQRDGLGFVNELRTRGWNEVGKLYTTAPPVSTEQILHPQKWLMGERPLTIQWPAFESNAAFADWELVEQDVLGELMLRAVFRVHYLSPMMGSAPAGWNGDRYAVFKRRDSGEMLLLLYTAWDREADAAAFAEAYRVVVKEKYAETPKPVRIVEEGRRVVIVEGGEESSLDALMKFALSATEIEDTAVER